MHASNALTNAHASALVRCDNLTKTYLQGDEEVHALVSVSLEIHSGEFMSLCGPSGSGKTTLLNLVGGLDRPTAGSVFLQEQHISALSDYERTKLRLQQIGFIFQSYNLIPVLTAQENVEFIMHLQGVASSDRGKRAKEALAAVGLGGLEDRRPGHLSGGQQQRVAIARAIVSNPSIILADEPTANLDSTTAEQLLVLMREMNKSRGITFVFSTHDKLVMDFAERIVKLKDGSIVSDETKN